MWHQYSNCDRDLWNPMTLDRIVVERADEATHKMVVTDAEGHVLWREGQRDVLRGADRIGLVERTRWTEDSITCIRSIHGLVRPLAENLLAGRPRRRQQIVEAVHESIRSARAHINVAIRELPAGRIVEAGRVKDAEPAAWSVA